MKKQVKYFMCDFETTVYSGQEYTEVWASACVELYTENVKLFHSIDDQFSYFFNLKENVIAYFHNLKFDGEFIISYLLTGLKFDQSIERYGENIDDVRFLNKDEMKNNTFRYLISDMGQWYSILIKKNNKFIEIRDSLKLLPFSVEKIGLSFKTKHKKLSMTYEGFRYAGCEITEKEEEYIKNDVLVVKEALEVLFNEGHKRLTIGSCALSEFRKTFHDGEWEELFPNLYDIEIDEKIYGYKTVGDYIYLSYHGGWCYLVKGKETKLYKNGITLDVNSLYPSMMHSESGNIYPIGVPRFWTGNYIPEIATHENTYYFIRIKTKFKIKNNKLPFIQIKNTCLYKTNEMLETSDVKDDKGVYYDQYIDLDGNVKDTYVTLTMTCTDFELFKKHYHLIDFEILDGCWFFGEIGLFDKYIDKHKKIKLTSKGAVRQLAKLFLNSLYGKLATTKNSSFKVAYVKEDGSIGYTTIIDYGKEPGYIPIGSAITSYARNFTINAAQQNYHGKNKPGFIYADTDSIHCDLQESKIKGVNIHDTNFCCWGIESKWKKGWFVRQKTYIEQTEEETIIKCAGMPERCKNLFLKNIGESNIELENLTDEEKMFLSKKLKITDFNLGLLVPGKLQPKRIKGGIVLLNGSYEMR